MSSYSWPGASQRTYLFASYPLLLPLDLATIARFYIGKPIIYAFVSQPSPADRPKPLYFGHADDGYQRLFIQEHGATAAAINSFHNCTDIHVLQAPENTAQRESMLADLLAQNPTVLQGLGSYGALHTNVFQKYS